jgi:hypothetical protein
MRRSAAASLVLLLGLAWETSGTTRSPGLEKKAASRQELLALGLPEIRWRDDYDTAYREAARKKRPLLLFFHNPDMARSKKMNREINHTPTLVRLLSRRFVPLLIDPEPQHKEVRDHLRIETYPAVVIADHAGKIHLRLEGYRTPARLSASLQSVLDKLRPAKKRGAKR